MIDPDTLGPAEQFELARRLAANVGYVLIEEPSIQVIEDSLEDPLPEADIQLILKKAESKHDHWWASFSPDKVARLCREVLALRALQ